ncbi:uncharacterized protein [Nicotiana tomentosiformis]|uniref:uncharacterized protein n=1 Tax=Nicotiana tomentosiformis TaxID=4098 RepID=UPI00388CD71A
MGNGSKRSFKYCNAWAQHSQFNQIVSDLWRTPIEGCKIFQIVKKLKLLKRKLRELNSQYFSNIKQTAKVDRQALKQVQERLQTDPSNHDLQQEEPEKYQKFRESSYLAEMFLQQKRKAIWIRLGDNNIGYFYSIIRHKRLKLANIQLKDDQGVSQTEPGAILKLLHPIEEREVKKELFQIDSNKNPGPDGYSSGFFKASWNILDCYISKVICSKLKDAVNYLVPDNQLALVQGRSMMHNVLIFHDLLRNYNRKTSPRYIIKIDLWKAYDMGEERSVNRVMEALKHFSEVSGLIANLEKSNIFMTGVTNQANEKLLAATGFSKGSFPISFWGAIFILPQSVLKEVDKRCRDYLWDSSEDKRRVPLVAWEKICCPKKNGGLNIKGCSSWNKASAGKLLWQLTDKWRF